MLVTCDEMRALEDAVFATGVAADSLMERAGEGMAKALQQFFPSPGHLIIVGGKGHNAGDALVAARHLLDCGWSASVRFAFPVEELRSLTAAKLKMLQDRVSVDSLDAPVPEGWGPMVVMDGLLGIGAGGALRGGILDACKAVSRLRREARAATVAVDIPTGLNGDSGQVDPDAVIADYAFTVAAVKTGLVADSAINHVGRLVVVPLAELEPVDDGVSSRVADARLVRSRLPIREFDTHKGKAGRVGLIAGSVGLTGAARPNLR